MSFENQSVSIHYAQSLIAAAQRRHLDYLSLLEFAGINPVLMKKAQARITPEQYSRLMQSLWQSADDEFMCMAKTPIKHGVFALMAKQAVHSKDLGAVYYHLCRFYNLVTDSIRLELVTGAERSRLIMQLSEPYWDPRHTLREFLLLLWHRFPSWLVGQRFPLTMVGLNYPKPVQHREHRLLFPCPIRYEQSTCWFEFDNAQLRLPVVQTPSGLRQHLVRAPIDWFKRQDHCPIYTRRVMDVLQNGDEFQDIDMPAVAELLHITTRTLHRKLEKENTSFKSVKNAIRRDVALRYLNQQGMPISQISRQLGFSEPAAFTRAFKRWTGVHPNAYRHS